jgi:hypothetical protein
MSGHWSRAQCDISAAIFAVNPMPVARKVDAYPVLPSTLPSPARIATHESGKSRRQVFPVLAALAGACSRIHRMTASNGRRAAALTFVNAQDQLLSRSPRQLSLRRRISVGGLRCVVPDRRRLRWPKLPGGVGGTSLLQGRQPFPMFPAPRKGVLHREL